MKNNNLQETLVTNVNWQIEHKRFNFLDQPLRLKFLDKDNHIGIVPAAGSHKLDEDYSGESYWVYNYVITISTQNKRDAKNKLFELSDYFQELKKLPNLDDPKEVELAKDSDWVFDQVIVSSDPHEVDEDISGTAMYELDIAVYVYRKLRGF